MNRDYAYAALAELHGTNQDPYAWFRVGKLLLQLPQRQATLRYSSLPLTEKGYGGLLALVKPGYRSVTRGGNSDTGVLVYDTNDALWKVYAADYSLDPVPEGNRVLSSARAIEPATAPAARTVRVDSAAARKDTLGARAVAIVRKAYAGRFGRAEVKAKWHGSEAGGYTLVLSAGRRKFGDIRGSLDDIEGRIAAQEAQLGLGGFGGGAGGSLAAAFTAVFTGRR